MALQRIVLKLTELRCLAQSESGAGSEPYLWTTFFAFGAERRPLQTGLLEVVTPSYNEFRTEFPDGIRAGSAAPVPVFIASGAFDFDLDSVPRPKLLGAIAVLMEQDSTPQSSIVLGRIAYSKEIENQLNILADARVRSGNFGAITDAEIGAMKNAVSSKVKAAIGSNQSVFDLFRDQDDNLGLMFKTFTFPSNDPASEIRPQFFDFPDSGTGSGNRFRLSGMISIGAVPKPPVVRCPAQRAALKAKQDEIASLQTSRQLLQTQLQNAAPQQKAALVAMIKTLAADIERAEAQLPALQAALDACLAKGPGGKLPDGITIGDTASKTR